MFAHVAQLVEHRYRKPKVRSAILLMGSISVFKNEICINLIFVLWLEKI
jgi:hypothetical protein